MATDRVIFNVGGTRFETTRQTVNSLPDNYFAKFIAASWRDVSATEIFIDRDPACFSHFLNYLRARVVPGGLSKKEWCALKVEAEYYDILDVLPPDPDLNVVEELVPDDLSTNKFPSIASCSFRKYNILTLLFYVCLTPEAVEDIGQLMGRIPPADECCYKCDEYKHLNYDVFGRTGRCPQCSKQLSGIWKCVEAQLHQEYNRSSTTSPHLLNSLSQLGFKYDVETRKFTVRKIPKYGNCVLLYSPQHPLPVSIRSEQPHAKYSIHIPRKYLRKVGHKKPGDDDYLYWTCEEIEAGAVPVVEDSD